MHIRQCDRLAACYLDQEHVDSSAEPTKAALFFGSEGYGLDKKTIKACDITTIIPMSHQVDSLNVAASSAVAFWELFARQLWWNAFNRDTKNGHLQVQMAVSLR